MLQELAPANSNSSGQPQAQSTTLAPLNAGVDAFLSSLDASNRAALLASPKAVGGAGGWAGVVGRL